VTISTYCIGHLFSRLASKGSHLLFSSRSMGEHMTFWSASGKVGSYLWTGVWMGYVASISYYG
jgi:hypothetical protein